MTAYRFLILDVFSATAFGGNQLAVLPDATGIADAGLQKLAAEFNFPESTFVVPASAPDCLRRVRIFTPQRELPFAGHPTVGTACALVAEGIADEGSFRLEEGIGPVEVNVVRGDGGPSATLTVRQAPSVTDGSADPAVAAAVLGVPEKAIRRVFSASLGVDFTYIQLDDPDTVDAAALDQSAWTARFARRADAQLFFFAGDLAHGASLHARMFAPAFGIAEDPATGAASSILAGAAATLTGATGDRFSLTIHQGVAMGRPSRLDAAALLDGGKVSAVAVGGAATLVAEGEIQVPRQFLLD